MERRQRRSFTDDYKRQAVDLVASSGRSVGSVAKELGLRDSVLRRWVEQRGAGLERFGNWKNIHNRFSSWAASGIWESLFKTLADDPDNEYAMIDATIVRAHQHSAGARKKGVATKPSAARAAALRRKST